MPEIVLTDYWIQQAKTHKKQVEFYDKGHHSGGSFGIRLAAGGRKSFFLIYPLNGKRKRLTLGHFPALSLEKARVQAEAAIVEASNGRDPAAIQKGRLPSRTFSALVKSFISEHAAKNLSPKTTNEYKRIIDSDLLPAWKDMLADDISAFEINYLINQIRIERGSAVMAERTQALVNKIFNFAIKKGLVQTNPVENVEETKSPESSRDRLLSDEELKTLWHALAEENSTISTLYKLLILTGQRLTDLLSAKWNDLTLDVWNLERRQQKTTEIWQIPLSPLAAQVLKEHKNSVNTKDEIFLSSRKKPLKEVRKISRRLNKLINATSPWEIRDLRRTVEYNLRRLKIRPDVIEQCLTRRTYSPIIFREKSDYDYTADVRAAFNAWSRKVDEIVNQRPGGPKKGPNSKILSLFGN